MLKCEMVSLAVLALAVPTLAQAQTSATPTPRPAQREMVTALLNGKKLTVEYGRPALSGRSVQDLLAKLPEYRVWRTGENQATTLVTESHLLIGGQRVPAGKYTLYLHAPGSGNYELLVNSDTGVPLKTLFAAAPPELANELWPQHYPAIRDKEVARIPLQSTRPGEAMERFLIGLAPAKDAVSSITLTWGDQSWTAEIRPAPPVSR